MDDCHSINDGHQPEIYFQLLFLDESDMDFQGFFFLFCFAASAFCTQLAYYLDVSCFRPWISNLVDSVRDLWGGGATDCRLFMKR